MGASLAIQEREMAGLYGAKEKFDVQISGRLPKALNDRLLELAESEGLTDNVARVNMMKLGMAVYDAVAQDGTALRKLAVLEDLSMEEMAAKLVAEALELRAAKRGTPPKK